jgi:hypothetical protein
MSQIQAYLKQKGQIIQVVKVPVLTRICYESRDLEPVKPAVRCAIQAWMQRGSFILLYLCKLNCRLLEK